MNNKQSWLANWNSGIQSFNPKENKNNTPQIFSLLGNMNFQDSV